MTKAKFLVLLFAFVILMLGVHTVVNATTVEYTRTIPSNEGTIKLNFTGLELDVNKAYQFALVRQGSTPETWFNIDDGYTENSASITLSSATSVITAVLKATDTGFIYIREEDDTTGAYILQAYQVDLKLPYLQSLVNGNNGSSYCLGTSKLYGSIGNNYSASTNVYYKWELVEDEELIEEFLNIKNNERDIIGLESFLPEPPSTGYINGAFAGYSDKNDGLYLLWVKRSGENCKDVYSCIVHDGLEEATTVEQYIQSADVEAPRMENLRIEFSNSFVYDDSTGYQYVAPGTTITIKATFDEILKGNTAPTLKIKCGNGEEKTVPAGTITGQYILYNYTIKEQDKGIIAAVSMTGGDVADEEGNTVSSYTCPTLYTNWMSAIATNKIVFANGSGIATDSDNQQENTNKITIVRGNNNQFIKFPSSLTRSSMKNWDGNYVYSGTIERINTSGSVTFQIQYAGIKSEKVAEIQAKSDSIEDDNEFNNWLNNYVKANYINEENWENLTNMKINLECILGNEAHEHLVFVKVIDGDNEYIVWQGYGEGFSRVLSTRVNVEENPKDDDKVVEDDKKEEGKKDDTTSPIVLPNTGLKVGLVILLVISIISVVAYFRYNKLKGI